MLQYLIIIILFFHGARITKGVIQRGPGITVLTCGPHASNRMFPVILGAALTLSVFLIDDEFVQCISP